MGLDPWACSLPSWCELVRVADEVMTCRQRKWLKLPVGFQVVDACEIFPCFVDLGIVGM